MGQRTQGVYTGSAPYCEGKSLIQFEVVLLGFRLPGSEYAWPSFRFVVSCPKPLLGRPLIYTG